MQLREADALVGEDARRSPRKPRGVIDGRIQLVCDRLCARLRSLGHDRVGDLVRARTEDARRLAHDLRAVPQVDRPPGPLRLTCCGDDAWELIRIRAADRSDGLERRRIDGDELRSSGRRHVPNRTP